MLRFLQWLWYGHIHKWKIIDEITLNGNDGLGGTYTCTRYNMQCEHCGEIKTKDAR